MNKSTTFSKPAIVFLIGLLVLLATSFLAITANGWNQVFDDSFISYRYAYNLAQGYGLVWNPREAPTEGFTNILLVLLLAPFVKVGISPLFVTRILSYFSVAIIASLLFKNARQNWQGSKISALLVSCVFIFAPQTRALSLVGLETVIYSLFLFISFIEAEKALKNPSIRSGLRLAASVLLSMWLRPEACLLYFAFFITYGITFLKSSDTHPMKPLLLATSSIMVLGGLYLLWKKAYFGDVLPNPFYIKASGSGFQPSGIQSVVSFFEKNALIVIFFLSALIRFRKAKSFLITSSLGVLILILYILFFSRTTTLMDIEGRFMYPMLAIIIYLATPALVDTFEKIITYAEKSFLRSIASALLLFVAFSPPHAVTFANDLRVMTARPEKNNSLMQKEFRIANILAQFPGIEKVKIAFGDAGVIPYYTKAQWLDVVGLNDTFIAREKNIDKLLNYFFKWNPDVVICPGSKSFQWFKHGHGPLGDYTTWMTDPRWDNYSYAGSSITDGSYDLHFYIHKNASRELVNFIQHKVADGYFAESPIEYGTMKPSKLPQWTSTGIK